MSNARTDELVAVYRDGLLRDTIPFWTNHAIDEEHGGFFTFLDRDGSVYGTDKPVWLQGRIVWVFSRLYNAVEKRREWLDLARHGLDFLLKHCIDTDGRLFFLTTREGVPLRKRRYLFAETFAVMGLAEFAKASGEDWARAKAAEVFDTLMKYYTTPGLLDPKVIPGARPMKSHAMPMILLATCQVIRQVDDRPIYRETVDNSIHEVFDHFCHPELKALLEHVAPGGEFMDMPEGRVVLPGHAIETAWFIMEEGRARGDRELSLRALPILEWSLERGWDNEFGGLLYYTDVLGKPCTQYEWDMKLWWPHTEALYATLLAHHLTGDPKWETWRRKIHDYAYSHFPDPEYGEWYGYLHRDGSVSHRLKGNLWKGPYHLSRMQLLSWKLLEEMQAHHIR
jgi:N-acylglucosamine 2-epimerase